MAMTYLIFRCFHSYEPIDPENIVFANGCTSLCDLIGQTIAEEGDGILISQPCYQAFQRDFGARAKYAFPLPNTFAFVFLIVVGLKLSTSLSTVLTNSP